MNTTVALVHIVDPLYANGGADRRAQALHESLSRDFDTRLHRIEVGRQPVVGYWRLRAAISGIPPRAAQAASAEIGPALGRIVADSDVVIGSTLFTAALIPPCPRLVYDAHNLEWRVLSELAARGPSAARRAAYRATLGWTRRFEARLGSRAAEVWAVSAQEAAWFAEHGARVSLVPNGVELPPLVPVLPPAGELLFVGSMESAFNQGGMRWFLSDVWPLIRSARPKALVKVIGAGPDIPLPDGAVRLGYVDDLAPHYASAAVCLAPLRAGAGTRLKVLEGMAHGRPVVSTTIGSEGLEVSEGDGVIIADRASDFAEACLRLLSSPGRAAELGARGRVRAEQYSWDRVAEAAVESIHRIAGS